MFYSKLFKLSRIYSFSSSNSACHSKVNHFPNFCFKTKRNFHYLFLVYLTTFFQALFAKLRKATISFLMSVSRPVCLSVCRMEQLGSYWMDFQET